MKCIICDEYISFNSDRVAITFCSKGDFEADPICYRCVVHKDINWEEIIENLRNHIITRPRTIRRK